ncbi:DUF2283 domain-containing protein [Peribacillus frigoritolerans]|uniref:DUF2283 domain-containing protein n=1 Tax=Peribacillus frigoritolerans TaxID=450367 RepID=UPI00203CED88|nr:DUF2283 domain-containing protein [Peribacillus frigoritolerans]MCM3168069.1 DUF2283 domain-containing protein [Peribacillus frigoritolerans]
MKSRITYDKEAKLAYLYPLPSSVKDKIVSTIELEVNDLELDIDEVGRIIGIEFFGPVISKLSKKAGSTKFYKKNGKKFSFRLWEKM